MMMKANSLHKAVGFVSLCLMACTNDIPDIGQTNLEPSSIYLSAGVGKAMSSRSPYQPTDGNGNVLSYPTTAHPLDVSVWASTTSGVYPNSRLDGREGTVAIHTHASFQSGDPQLLGEAIYPKKPEGSDAPVPVYFIGLHPESKDGSVWTTATNENKGAQFTFKGKEDVMFAPQISGTYGIDYNSSPAFHFYHLLTWLRFEVVADKDETDVKKREAIAAAWGKIKTLTIKSKSKVSIPDVGGVTSGNLVGSVSYDNEVDMSLYKTASDDVYPESGGSVIPTKGIEEVAYVMCAPVTGVYKDADEKMVPEYTLHIETENRTLDIPVDLRIADIVDKNNDGVISDEERKAAYFLESTMGKQFTILLNFKMGDVISVATMISVGGETDWFTHGTGNGDIGEEDLDIPVGE